MNTMESRFAFIAVAVLFIAPRSYDNRQRAKQEKELFALAIKKGGRLTITEIVNNTTLNVAQAESILSTMRSKGHIGIIPVSNMPNIYDFGDVADDEEASQLAPSTQKRFSVKEVPVFEEDEKDEEENVSHLVENINTASNAYRNWLPEVLEKLESYHRYPATVALPKFKEYVVEKIAYKLKPKVKLESTKTEHLTTHSIL